MTRQTQVTVDGRQVQCSTIVALIESRRQDTIAGLEDYLRRELANWAEIEANFDRVGHLFPPDEPDAPLVVEGKP